MNAEIVTKKCSLPFYSEGEETFHVASHAFGVLLGIGMIITIYLYHQNITQLVSGILFGLSLVFLYAMSCTYHGLSPKGAGLKDKKDFQVVDHCSIPILIIGTYIPLALCIMEPAKPGMGWKLMGVICIIACIIIALNIIDLDRFKTFTMIGYFLMGGSVLIGSDIIINALTIEGFTLFITGGIVYGVGAIFYGLGGKNKVVGKSKKWMHSIFHIFCILGSVLHCVCVYLYVFGY
ncbi:MAG: PAQR family membrane homeostasis protein TrhA [Oscillospiraceae bacterium]|jgi:hemolysin III